MESPKPPESIVFFPDDPKGIVAILADSLKDAEKKKLVHAVETKIDYLSKMLPLMRVVFVALFSNDQQLDQVTNDGDIKDFVSECMSAADLEAAVDFARKVMSPGSPTLDELEIMLLECGVSERNLSVFLDGIKALAGTPESDDDDDLGTIAADTKDQINKV